MTERERWIVYPLVLFALGAALRDKFSQSVTTKELTCQRLVAKQIECEGGLICEGVVVLDPDNRSQPLVEMGRTDPTAGPDGQTRRFGALILRDNSGQILCGALNNELYVRRVNCEGVRIVDPTNPERTLAGLGSVTVADKEKKQRPFGVLVLNNEDFGTITGNPPRDVVRPQPGQGSGTPPATEQPAEDASADEAPAEQPAAEPAEDAGDEPAAAPGATADEA
jgi:hypothetical protein